MHQKPRLKSVWHWLRVLLSGFCMGTADLVPGVSGGTMAWITGIYEDLVHSITTLNFRSIKLLLTGKFRQVFSTVAWEFLGTLVLGMALAMVTLSSFFRYCLHNAEMRPLLYATFFGLIIASILFCARLIRSWRPAQVIALSLGLMLGFGFTQIKPQPAADEQLYAIRLSNEVVAKYQIPNENLRNYGARQQHLLNVKQSDAEALYAKGIIGSETAIRANGSQAWVPAGTVLNEHKSYGLNWWAVFCGSIGVCAMLLPGISGAYLLSILGMYAVAIGALADFTHGLREGSFDVDAALLLGSLAIGIGLGAALFSRVISWLFDHYHCATIALLTGFMAGALPTIWPFWELERYLNPLRLKNGVQLDAVRSYFPDISSPMALKAGAFALAGFLLVVCLEAIAIRFGVAEEPEEIPEKESGRASKMDTRPQTSIE